MNKSVALLLIAILGCVYSLHMANSTGPAYGPSTPGGTYQQQPNGTVAINGTQSSSQNIIAMINGQPYYYTGPFTLACWLPTNTYTPFKYDTCWDQVNCARMLQDYTQCRGTVKKYPPLY